MTRRAAGSVLLAAALLLGASGSAYFHAELLASDPANGAHLGASPPRIRLLFSEPVDIGLARLTLVRTDGERPLPSAVADPRDVNALVVPLDTTGPGAIGAGANRVRWRVVSLDGHPVDGSFTFTVGTTSETGAVADSIPGSVVTAGGTTWPVALLRGIALGLLMLLAGLLAFGVRRDPGGALESPRFSRGVHALALVVPVVLAAQLLVWAVRVSSPGEPVDSIGAALASDAARIELFRLACAGLAAWALVLARRKQVALVFAAAAVALSGAIGHAMAVDPRVSVVAKSIHLLAGAAWLGGVAWLATLVRGDATTLARAASRVSRVAFAAVATVVVTGTVQSLLLVPSVLDLVRTTYGLLLLAKVLGTLVLVGFGAYHRRRSLPALRHNGEIASLRSALRLELIVMAAVLVLGGALSSTEPPPTEHAAVASVHSVP